MEKDSKRREVSGDGTSMLTAAAWLLFVVKGRRNDLEQETHKLPAVFVVPWTFTSRDCEEIALLATGC